MPDREIQNAVIRHARNDMEAVPGASQITPNEQSFLGVVWESLKDPQQYAVLWAEWRRGLKDLQNAVLGPWGGTHEELGTIANPTPQIVTEQIDANFSYHPANLREVAGMVNSPKLEVQDVKDFDADMARYAANPPTQDPSKGIDR